MQGNPEMLTSVGACVAHIVERAGGELRVAAPLGLGKPNVLLNALYRRVAGDAALRLDIYTALSLARPQPKSDLERRFVEPFLARHFGEDYPDLLYVAAQKAGTLPANVRIHEFYVQSGAMLGVESAQRDYASMNYTHVARDLVDRDINVIVQLIAAREEAGRIRYSLACNPDVTADLLDRMRDAGAARPYVVGIVHPDLPFVGNEAEVEADFFDALLFDQANRHTLFALPRAPIDPVEYAIGLHASALVRDGGTLQIGIGALSDAIVHALLLRQRDNAAYGAALAAVGAQTGAGTLAARIGGLDGFATGLYGASEMVMDGFMHLAEAGILRRRVYDDYALEQALEDGSIEDTLHAHAADALYACGALGPYIDKAEFARLLRFGLLPEGAQLAFTTLLLPDGSSLPLDLGNAEARTQWNRVLAGRRLREGRYLRGAFYLGSKAFYAWLRGLDGAAFDGLSMTRVSDINQLYGGRESLDALQRRDARFFNTCMMATLLGAATSDALADGQVISGVGGQYNFVAMAHALTDGRSVLLLRATREHAGRTESNILWNYGHTTIPRHLRDIYVTEYGVADLRGKSDEDCILAMLAIADARFQDGLAAQAKAAGKLRRDFAIPAAWRANTGENLMAALKRGELSAHFPAYPFGSDFDETELRLLPALTRLKALSAKKSEMAFFLLRAFTSSPPVADAEMLLARLNLHRPATLAEKLMRRLVLAALADADKN
ncbi:acetyl-CoA hydrolase/transferase C-terminal domain-containing protein [Rudaea cellulosilytica]|uniref:acetyl-CoA hydrolase/transferase C-terminal domain-containing protein n=1 Tax=Rudaea cellulosilytica TaxID=540746 RepID=UPI0012FABD38|nr:acetyl-CoA hydrolase/transferase C-terminal domain-containing protein [Rudaea cellulosilytica]